MQLMSFTQWGDPNMQLMSFTQWGDTNMQLMSFTQWGDPNMQLMSFTQWGDPNFLADSVQKKKLFQHLLRVSTKSQIYGSLQRLHKVNHLHRSNNWFWGKSGKRREEGKTAKKISCCIE
jgi:hypothetical protein